MGDTIERLIRRTAKSGKVDYAPSAVIHETSATRLNAVAFFIPRSNGTELQVKIEGFTKRSGQPWAIEKKKTINLTDAACRELQKFLEAHLALSRSNAGGEYLMLRVSDGEVALGDHDPRQVVRALTQVLSQPDLVSHLAGAELTHELASALRGSLHLQEMRAAVAQLREHLESGEASEQVYQTWCEDHCWAFGNAYVMRDAVRCISPGDNLDLLLPGVFAGFRDIVELKRPDKEVLVYDKAHRNYYFGSEVSKAIGQCHRYLDVLHDAAEHGLRDHEEVVAYHPRATIVVGRSDDWAESQQRALHGLNRRMNGITVMTYDHLLAQGERLLEMMVPTATVEVRVSEPAEDDDIPW